MNLIGDPWIPAVFEDVGREEGEAHTVGLRELYERSAEIRDLSLNPPQRIAVMRLLLCITQAALDGPEDEDDWRMCRDRIVPESLGYLEDRFDRFDLLGDRPFLQVRELETKKLHLVDELDDRPKLFDHAAFEPMEARTKAWAALNLLALLNFSRQGRVGQGVWAGEQLSHQTFEAPCVNKLHSFIRTANLMDTIHLNLLPKSFVCSQSPDTWGCPVWDAFPESRRDLDLFWNASMTYLGRLVPLSRFIRLSEHEQQTGKVSPQAVISPTHRSLDFRAEKMGGHLPPMFIRREKGIECREPSTTVITDRKTGEDYCLRVDSRKHVWREAASVLALSKSMTQGGVPAIRNIRKFPGVVQSNIDVWSGGLHVVNNAKIEDAAEWIVSVPLGVLDNLLVYERGVEKANVGDQQLNDAINEYLDFLGLYAVKRDKAHREARRKIRAKASQNYWNELDGEYAILIDVANRGGIGFEQWLQLLARVRHDAYSRACPHETPRQIQAFAVGRSKLYRRESALGRTKGKAT